MLDDASIKSEASFTKRVIDGVKSRPALYVKDDANYYMKSVKDDLWREISKEAGQPVSACRQRWKALRERFTKVLKKVNEAQTKGEHCNDLWCYYHDMLFLKDVVTTRNGYSKADDIKSRGSSNRLSDGLNDNELSTLSFEDVDLSSSLASSPAVSNQLSLKRHRTSEAPLMQLENKKSRASEDILYDVLDKMRNILAEFSKKKDTSYLSSSMDALQGLITDLPKDLQDACLMDMFKRAMEARSEARARNESSKP